MGEVLCTDPTLIAARVRQAAPRGPAPDGLGCAGCGRCCDPVWLSEPPETYRRWAEEYRAGARGTTAAQESNYRTAVFIDSRMSVLDPQPEQAIDGTAVTGIAYRCSAYDPQARLCTAHEDRPDLCRGYPWYEEAPAGPASHPVLPDGCSYRWDLPVEERGPVVGRLIPLWPVEPAGQEP